MVTQRSKGKENPISGCGLIEFDIVKGAGRPCGAYMHLVRNGLGHLRLE